MDKRISYEELRKNRESSFKDKVCKSDIVRRVKNYVPREQDKKLVSKEEERGHDNLAFRE